MYVMSFLCDFTTWTDAHIQTFISHEGSLTLGDVPRLFDLPRYRKWDIPWNDAGVEMGADIIFPDIDPTENVMMMKPPQMTEDPVKPMMMGQSQMIADPVQQMYVMIFLCAFTSYVDRR